MKSGSPIARCTPIRAAIPSAMRSLSVTESAAPERNTVPRVEAGKRAEEALHYPIGKQRPPERQRRLCKRHVEIESSHHGAVLDRQPDDVERVIDHEGGEHEVEEVEVHVQCEPSFRT